MRYTSKLINSEYPQVIELEKIARCGYIHCQKELRGGEHEKAMQADILYCNRLCKGLQSLHEDREIMSYLVDVRYIKN